MQILVDAQHTPDLPSYTPSHVFAAHSEVQLLADSMT
jgi:hypothetical protein